jgi:hypothetical protein
MLLSRIVLVFFVLIVSCNRTNANTSIEGVYQSISESEWAVTVTLLSGSKAEIELENWLAGEYDKRTIRIVKSTWSKVDNKIVMKYDGITDVLIYSENLSLSDLGLEGGAPGLMQEPPIAEKSIVHGIKLWKKPHEFSKKRN